MLASEAKKWEGSIVGLDLVNGTTVTTRVKSVNVSDGTITLGKLINFQAMPDPRNPQNMQVLPVPYGAPLFDAPSEVTLDCSHVLMLFKAGEEMCKAYTHHTSGIQAANANVLDSLKDVDFTKFQNNA
jgi:hypothetical protein